MLLRSGAQILFTEDTLNETPALANHQHSAVDQIHDFVFPFPVESGAVLSRIRQERLQFPLKSNLNIVDVVQP